MLLISPWSVTENSHIIVFIHFKLYELNAVECLQNKSMLSFTLYTTQDSYWKSRTFQALLSLIRNTERVHRLRVLHFKVLIINFQSKNTSTPSNQSDLKFCFFSLILVQTNVALTLAFSLVEMVDQTLKDICFKMAVLIECLLWRLTK